VSVYRSRAQPAVGSGDACSNRFATPARAAWRRGGALPGLPYMRKEELVSSFPSFLPARGGAGSVLKEVSLVWRQGRPVGGPTRGGVQEVVGHRLWPQEGMPISLSSGRAQRCPCIIKDGPAGVLSYAPVRCLGI
jgi:hypothetical protein